MRRALAVLLILSSLAFAQRTVCSPQSDGSYICQPDSPASARRLAIVGAVIAGGAVIAWAVHRHHKKHQSYYHIRARKGVRR